jgi:hypothetical protein
MTRAEACDAVDRELSSAMLKWPSRSNSPRHLHSIIEEEYDEFWDAIKADDFPHAEKECIQLAAMALRYLIEARP